MRRDALTINSHLVVNCPDYVRFNTSFLSIRPIKPANHISLVSNFGQFVTLARPMSACTLCASNTSTLKIVTWISIRKTCLCPDSYYIACLSQTTRSRMRYSRSSSLSLIDCFSSLRRVGPGQEKPECLRSSLQWSLVLRIPAIQHSVLPPY